MLGAATPLTKGHNREAVRDNHEVVRINSAGVRDNRLRFASFLQLIASANVWSVAPHFSREVAISSSRFLGLSVLDFVFSYLR
ncbi:hypothetical protein, partial [Kosmotoga sp.]|uniref:hypothetical protein n=1 Tax=Kosmotoga sp. TaxID=1955248 RepID=UPI00258CDF91